ncbi:sugar transferase [Fructilactobacillus myrtifloralis]|uniref:Sugar transferase n=1 Tax=Fructilactobacillus myrtifloralis TaxID=2940301 RepID=A0ABY5BM30_9LACO|nr:sugar transferase [Fructilactobacillus myrtifloralis]USS84732.1 sugar transferase [Fructilactobacillus myrtifloralis]
MKENHENKIWLDKKAVQDRPFYFSVKRITDLFLSVIGVILLSPVFLIVGILVKFDGSHGKILYVQERVGLNEQPFRMYKFRSMIPDADQKLQTLKNKNEVNGAMFKIKEDPRITKVGKFIRKYSLDELPQLFNVIKGDMSLVGPRPPLPSEVADYTDYDRQRLWVKPGCTGLWQVTERNNTDFNGAVRIDLEYIKKSSFKFDLLIIIKTVKIMIKPNAAY